MALLQPILNILSGCHHSVLLFFYLSTVVERFKELLVDNSSVESYVEWLDNIVEEKVIQVQISMIVYYTMLLYCSSISHDKKCF